MSKISVGDLNDHTLEKRKYLENLGYTYRCIWESDFDKQMQEDSTIKSFIQQPDIVTPLELREAFLEVALRLTLCI